MTNTVGFNYPADVPPGPRRMTTSSSCFKYPAVGSPGMGNTGGCFGYAAPPALRSPRKMGWLSCFSYLADVPPGPGQHDVEEPAPIVSAQDGLPQLLQVLTRQSR